MRARALCRRRGGRDGRPSRGSRRRTGCRRPPRTGRRARSAREPGPDDGVRRFRRRSPSPRRAAAAWSGSALPLSCRHRSARAGRTRSRTPRGGRPRRARRPCRTACEARSSRSRALVPQPSLTSSSSGVGDVAGNRRALQLEHRVVDKWSNEAIAPAGGCAPSGSIAAACLRALRVRRRDGDAAAVGAFLRRRCQRPRRVRPCAPADVGRCEARRRAHGPRRRRFHGHGRAAGGARPRHAGCAGRQQRRHCPDRWRHSCRWARRCSPFRVCRG